MTLDQLPADGPPAGTSRGQFLRRTAAVGLAAGVPGALLAETATGARSRSPKAREKRERGLRCQITRILHLTVNVSDLDRAIEFYEATYPVTRAERINGPPQAFRGLGIEHGQFEGRVMRDSQDFPGRALQLIQWKSPGPVGEPYKEANHVGYYRHHASAQRSGLQARYEAALAAGGRPYGPPSSIFVTPTATVNAFAFRDPDGTTLEYTGPIEPNPDAPPDRLSAYNANCRDLSRSFPFYRDVVGMDFTSRLNPVDPQPPTSGSLGDTLRNPDGTLYDGLIDYDAAILGLGADNRNPIDLLEWEMPRPFGQPYARANNLGTTTSAFEVYDVWESYKILVRALRKPHRSIMAPPEEWDMGEFGTHKVLTFRDPDGILIQLYERPAVTAEEPV